MKDYNTVFLDSLKEIQSLLEDQNYEGAFKTSANIVRFSNTVENPEGVFVSEILEGIFSQVGPIIDNMQLPEQEIAGINKNIQETYSELIIAVDKGNMQEVFKSLVQLRFIATQFQLKWRRIGKSKASKKAVQLPPQIEAMMKNMLPR